jgi:hypothetical protein
MHTMREQYEAKMATLSAAADKAATEHANEIEAQRVNLKGVLTSLSTDLRNIDEKVSQ